MRKTFGEGAVDYWRLVALNPLNHRVDAGHDGAETKDCGFMGFAPRREVMHETFVQSGELTRFMAERLCEGRHWRREFRGGRGESCHVFFLLDENVTTNARVRIAMSATLVRQGKECVSANGFYSRITFGERRGFK